jgi:hypothetical protein
VDNDSGCTGTLNGYFAGRLDEVRIYDRALSASELQNASDPYDSDDDGMSDGFELSHGFDPHDPADAAADADADGLDNLGEQNAGTDPHAADSDGDGFEDGHEISAGSDPLDDQSFPATPVPSVSPWSALLLIGLLAGLPAWVRRQRVP